MYLGVVLKVKAEDLFSPVYCLLVLEKLIEDYRGGEYFNTLVEQRLNYLCSLVLLLIFVLLNDVIVLGENGLKHNQEAVVVE